MSLLCRPPLVARAISVAEKLNPCNSPKTLVSQIL